MNRIARLAGLAATAALTGSLLAPSAAHADGIVLQAGCSEYKDTAGTAYEVRLCDVTDVDQFRYNLPGNGNAYCGPGSLYNILYYLEEHKGLKSRIASGGESMTAYSPYDADDQDEVTAWLGWLGWAAGMGPSSGGTGSAELREAFDLATSKAQSEGWTAASGGIATDTTPEFGYEIAKRLRNAPVQIWYGRYTQNADLSLNRTGGHIVTVVSAKGSIGSGKVELTLADPGRAGDHNTGDYLGTQSATRYEKVTLYRMAINRRITPSDGSAPYNEQHTYWRLLGEEYTGSTYQFVEGLNWFAAAPPVG